MPSASLGCISIPRESVSSFSFFSFFVVALSVLSQKCTDALNAICKRYSSFSCSPRMFFTVFDDFVHSLLTLTPSALRFDLLESLRLSARSGDLEICCSDESASEKPLLLFTFSHPSSAKSSSRTSSLLPLCIPTTPKPVFFYKDAIIVRFRNISLSAYPACLYIS